MFIALCIFHSSIFLSIHFSLLPFRSLLLRLLFLFNAIEGERFWRKDFEEVLFLMDLEKEKGNGENSIDLRREIEARNSARRTDVPANRAIHRSGYIELPSSQSSFRVPRRVYKIYIIRFSIRSHSFRSKNTCYEICNTSNLVCNFDNHI